MAASYLREKCVDFIWHSRGTSPNEVWDGEWVRVRMSGYMLQKKAKHLHQMCWETCRHNFCVIGAVVFGILLQMTTKKNLMFAWGDPKTSKSNKSHKWIERYNYQLRWTSNHHKSAVHRLERAPSSTCPSNQSATLSDMCVNGPIVYEWLDSVQRSQVHLLQQDAPIGAPPSPPGGWGRSPAARVACAREWTDELCVLGCVRDWENARLGENACRDGEKETNTTSGEKWKWETQQWGHQRCQAFGWKRLILYISLKGRTLDMKTNRHHKDYIFVLS